MEITKYIFFTSTGELREEPETVLDERDDIFWVEDKCGFIKTVSKKEMDKVINNPLFESIRVYTAGSKEDAVSLILREYWKYAQKIDKDYKVTKERVSKNLSVLEKNMNNGNKESDKEIEIS